MIVPTNVKNLVKRIRKEYEDAYDGGEEFSLQIMVGDTIYSGRETTKIYLRGVDRFIILLDSQEGDIFCGTDDDVRCKIYLQIQEFYKPLSEVAVKRATREIDRQGQLMTALYRAKKKPDLVEDARAITWFINHAYRLDFGEEDSGVEKKLFKLITKEDEFEKLFEKSDSIKELFSQKVIPNGKIRVAFQRFSVQDLYKKKMISRKLRTFWESQIDNQENFDTAFAAFNLWNDVAETGIYYIYVPEN